MMNRFLLSIVFFSVFIAAKAQYGGGAGNADAPYIIGSPEHLIRLSNHVQDWNNKHFVLANDIDMSGKAITPVGNNDLIFTGNFDGNHKKIKNLTINPLEQNSGTGLFGMVNGKIANLGIENISITASGFGRVGAIVGVLDGGEISNCYSEGGNINVGGGGWAGGIVGVLFTGGSKAILNCYSSINISASWASGGIVGANRGTHKIEKVAFYGTITGGSAILTVQNDPTHDQKNGIPAKQAYFKISNASDENAIGLNDAALLDENSYIGFDFERIWKIDTVKGYAVLRDSIPEVELTFWEKLKTKRVTSDSLVEWKNFGPGMSGYNEEFWCHPSDTNAMFMGPDMHVSYGTWDNGLSWHSLKDFDGDGLDLERVNDMAFSLVNPDYGVAIERRGKVFETKDRGRTWQLIYLIPHAAESPWYNAHSKLAIHPTNDSIWYIGAGGFWDVKGNFRSKASPHGTNRPIYAYGYILKTTDKGKTWRKIASEISDKLDVGRIIINPNHPDSIVIATGQGMFVSADAGENWKAANTGLPNNLPKDLCAYFNPESKEYVLYTVEQSVYTESGNTIATKGGVFKSTNGGATWSNISGNLGLDFTVITNSSFRDRYALTVAYWLGKNKNEIKAKSYPIHTLPVFRRLVVNPLNKNELYLVPNQRHDKSFGPGDVWKTEDGGKSWKIVARHGTYWHEASNKSYWESKGMVTTPNVEFAHLQASLDEELETSSANRSLAINANGHVFIGINQQTHRSNNGGKSWQQVDDFETKPGSNAWIGRGDSDLPGRFMLHNTGIPERRLFCSGEHGLWQTAELEDYPDKDAVAVQQIEGQVHDINGNHGAHSISTVAVHPNNPNTIFILAWRQSHRGWLRKTTDGGKTWKNVVQLFDSDNGSWEATASQYSLIIDPVNPENMYFTAIYKPISCGTNSGPGEDLTLGEYGVHRSTDGGNTWEVINNGFPKGASVNRIIMHPDNPEILFAAVNQWSNNDPYGLYKSTNQGNSWYKITIPSKIRSVNNVFIDKNTKYIYISCGARTGEYEAGGVYRSKNEGKSWELFFQAPYVWHVETSPVNSNKILVNAAGQVGGAFKNPGFYLSQDDGNSWIKINRGIGQPDKMVDIELDPYNENILWAAGWGSGWFKGMIKTDSVKAVCNDAEVEELNDVSLYALGSLGNQLSYEWKAPEGIQLSSYKGYKTIFFAPAVERDTTFVVTLKVFNNTHSNSHEVKVKVIKGITSVIDKEKMDVKVYPNPASEKLFVQSSPWLSNKTLFSIYNIDGKLYEVINPRAQTSGTYAIPLEKYNNGMYFLKMNNNSEVRTFKFLVQK